MFRFFKLLIAFIPFISFSQDKLETYRVSYDQYVNGKKTDRITEFYYQKGGTGPFGIKSPVFPSGYKDDGTKFSLRKKKSFFGWLTKT